jgi:NAD-specific glutamate dehydrogenase
MPCLLIAEINQYLLEIYPVQPLRDHINSLQIDGIAPSFAEKPHEDFLNRLQAMTNLPLWLLQNSYPLHSEGKPRYVHTSDSANVHILEQAGEKIWQNANLLELEKHEQQALLRRYLTTRCNQNVIVIAPLAITPVLIALRSIHRFDPYLCDHYLKQFEPTLALLTPALADEILERKLSELHASITSADQAPSEAASAYLRLERKLHRQYREHG